MKFRIVVLLIYFSILPTHAQMVREYFFDDKLQVSDSNALVLIIKYPQTTVAATLGNRIFTDTAFIRYAKQNWYYEHKANHFSSHRCGFDMYFYSLTDGKLTYLNQLNSSCELYKIASTNLNLLFQVGQRLKIDTLDRIRYYHHKRVLFKETFINAYYNIKTEWGISKTKKYPILYYDGYFQTQFKRDTNLSINQNAENYIQTYTQNLEGINWNIPTSSRVITNQNNDSIRITVYLKSYKFEYFKNHTIKHVPFSIDGGYTLYLFYLDD